MSTGRRHLLQDLRVVIERRMPDELGSFDAVAQNIDDEALSTLDRGGSGGEFGFALADAVIPSLQFLAAALAVSKAWLDYRTTKTKTAEATLRSQLTRALKKRGLPDDAVSGLVKEALAVTGE